MGFFKKNKINPLTEEEKKELELLDNPEITFLSPSGGVIPILMGYFSNAQKRKEKVVELRTKMRMFELGLDPNENYQDYYKIRGEEEKRFDERFKNK